MNPATRVLIVTCEHASKRVPRAYASLFEGADQILASHRGHDIGALPVARYLTSALDAPLWFSRASRLLCDANRSVHHPGVFSAFTRDLPADQRQTILERHYHPYRDTIYQAVDSLVQVGAQVLHLSVHSFTPVLDGETRNADLGLLYDPARAWERSVARRWQGALRSTDDALRVRRNYPYRGAADGFTSWLRQRFPDPCYAGIEIECNQAITRIPERRTRLAGLLVRTLPAHDATRLDG